MGAVHAVVRGAATAPVLGVVGRWVVRRLLRGREIQEIESSPLLRRAVRFPIPDAYAIVGLPGGGRFRFWGPASPYLYWSGPGAMEPHVVPAFLERARGARTIIDGGANFGFYALAAWTVNPSARVIAFEPDPRMADLLERTVEINSATIEVHRLALADRAGTAELRLGNGLSTIVADPTAGGRRVTVRLGRLDDLVEGRVDLVKLDVEQAEALVLRGMERVLREHRPDVFCEVTPETRADVLAISEAAGYVALQLPGLTAAARSAGGPEDLLLVPQERRP